MELSVGDQVVVPGIGVGKVEAVEEMDLGDEPVEAYRIDLGEEQGRFWVPVGRAVAEGLRPPMDDSKVEGTWKLIKGQKAPKKRANWRRRQLRYQEMMMSNKPSELAKLIGELVAVRAKKRTKKQALSFHERRFLERAKKLMVAEIAAATGETEEAVMETLQETIAAAA